MLTADPDRLLIIEDDDDARAAMCDVAECLGYSADSVTSAGEALVHPALKEVPLILLDRVLPDAMAEDLLPELKQHAPDSSVIMITGYADLEGSLAALRLGVADYLLKPVCGDVLRESIERVLHARHRDRERLQTTRLAAIAEAMTGLSHESRNALQRGQASLDLLIDELSGRPEAMRLVERIQSAQDDLHRLYEDVKEYASPVRLTPVPCHVNELVRQTAKEVSARIGGTQLSLTESSQTPDLQCRADPYALRVVFRNLLNNALAATDDVAINITYRDATLSGRPALQVTIADNGPGISDRIRPQVFKEFFTTRPRGTGLGLAICRRLIEAHRGRIEFGIPDQGTEVRVTLPWG